MIAIIDVPVCEMNEIIIIGRAEMDWGRECSRNSDHKIWNYTST